MEDYEKKYNRAMEAMRQWIAPCYTQEQLNVLKTSVFPELKESEDEKMLKRVINIVDEYSAKHQIDNTDCIDWLEKQGLHAKFRNQIQVGDKVTRNKDGILVNLSQLNRVAKKNKNQYDCKPIWNDEDNLKMGTLIHVITNQKSSAIFEGLLPEELISWLISIKDRVQPKVELTQLDKNILEAAIAFVEQNDHFNCWRGVDKHSVLYALRSLIPQNTWKPSDDQMKALDFYIKNDYIDRRSVFGADVVELYNDLKKLT